MHFRLAIATTVLSACLLPTAWSQQALDKAVKSEPEVTDGNRKSESRITVDGYRNDTLAGWEILVSEQLERDQPEKTQTALRLAEQQLKDIVNKLPSQIVDRLRQVPIWFSTPYDGIRPTAEYHPNRKWLINNDRLPELAKCVQLTNIDIFERECKRMPMLMLHELAHAYHDQVLSFNHPEIVAAYEAADEAGLYRQVQRNNGRTEKAYALTNHKEYFAELSECFFGVNDFYPFTHEQLKKHDPKMERLLALLWQVEQDSAPSDSDASVSTTNWTRFRGPHGSGAAAPGTQLPINIGDDSVQWRQSLPGAGSSSPVIWGDRLFITSYDSQKQKLAVQCFSADSGKPQWRKDFDVAPYRVHPRNSFASSTAAVDQDHVYVTYASPDKVSLVALDHQGQQVWSRDLGPWQSQHGYGASPLVVDDKVILFVSQQADQVPSGKKPGNSRMIAVQAADGQDVWQSSLTPTRACYAVPTLVSDEQGQQRLIGCNTGDGFFSIDPADGKRIWSAQPFKMRTVASVVQADDLLIGSCGSGGGGNYLVAMRMGEELDQQPEVAFQVPRANYVPTPVKVGNRLLLVTDKGIGRCVDLKTGKVTWQERLATGFSGSLVAAGNHAYVMDEDGNLLVIRVDQECEVVAKYSLGDHSRSTPAISSNRLYCRTESELICLGEGK